MRHAGIAVAGAIILALAAPSVATADVPPASAAMIAKVNQMRHSSGLPALQTSETLVSSARGYARYMLKHDYFGHLASLPVGGHFQLRGETLAWHSGWRARVARTFSSWMASPPHRAALLDPAFRYIGAGKAKGRFGRRAATTWVAHLGGAPVPSVTLPTGY
jgi:uncharacterized protein YkwD